MPQRSSALLPWLSTRYRIKTSEVQARSRNTCYRCGGKHNGKNCLLDTSIVCYNCGKQDHLSRVCRSPKVSGAY